jgi:hypothetical protein
LDTKNTHMLSFHLENALRYGKSAVELNGMTISRI